MSATTFADTRHMSPSTVPTTTAATAAATTTSTAAAAAAATTSTAGSGSSHRLEPFVAVLAPAAWGLTYIVTTELLPPGRPLLAATLRALPAGIMLAAITRRRPSGIWWARAAVLGVLNIGAFFALLFVAAYRLPGGVAATLGSIQPLIAAGLAAVILGEQFRRSTAVAGVLGVVGVGLLVLRAGAALDAVGVAAGLAGAVSMATGVVLTKRWGRPVPLIAFTSWQLIAGGLLLAPIALTVEGMPPALDGRNLAGFAWLTIGGTAVPYVLWFRGVARLPVGQISLLGLASPLVATFAGFVVLGQTLTAPQIFGVLLVLAAMVVGQRPARPAGPAESGRPPRPTLLPARRRHRPHTEEQPIQHGPTIVDPARRSRPHVAGARTAGVLYLTIFSAGLFAEVGVRSQLVVRGDAGATAANILASPTLFRLGVAADIVMLLCDVAIAVVLFRLLAPISRTLSMVAAAFRLTQAAVLGLNLLSMFQALRILDDAGYLDAFGTDRLEALALLSLDSHRYGYILGLTFFGVATMVIARLAWISERMPRGLAVVLAVAGVGYVIDTFTFVMIPGYDGGVSAIVLAPAVIAEFWFAGWLLTKGRVLDQDVSTETPQLPTGFVPAAAA